MSSAFVKEPDGDDVFADLPDRPIGDERNLVTPHGLELIDAEISHLRTALATAQAKADRAHMAEVSRDLRYWAARRVSAELVPVQGDVSEVRFGHTVRIKRTGGNIHDFKIVGTDESDPAKGLLSYLSPLAEALIGGRIGDEIEAGPTSATIVSIKAG
jgi:transcription elongation GreA/GreB family factor